MEEYAIEDPKQLLDAASEFAYYPGVQNDASAKDFLDRFPLPAIISALQSKVDVPSLESTLVACLERIFRTKYGTSLIPQYMPFIQVGLRADSHLIRCLACKTVSYLLADVDGTGGIAAQLVIEYDVYPLLLDCLINGNEQVAAASMDAIKNLASFPEGMDIIFPANNSDEAMNLRNLAARCSSLGRIRVLALIVKLFSISTSVASIIYNSNLLSLLEAEVSNRNDMLMTLSVLELLYEGEQWREGVILEWKDPWCSDFPLYRVFPLFYSLSNCKAGYVKDHMIRFQVFCSWNIHLKRNLNDWEVNDMGRLMATLEGYDLGNIEGEDERLWMLDETRGFSVNSMYKALVPGDPSDSGFFPVQFIWNSLILTKVSFHLWEL